MKFIKVIAKETDRHGKPMGGPQDLPQEVLIPLEKVECIIKTPHGTYTVRYKAEFLLENRLSIVSVKTNLAELFRQFDSL